MFEMMELLHDEALSKRRLPRSTVIDPRLTPLLDHIVNTLVAQLQVFVCYQKATHFRIPYLD